MYTIKIRGSEREIVEELADFGRPSARVVNLRLVNVRQTHGIPNQVGSVIRYSIPFFGLSSEMQLTKRVGFETLLYQIDERLVNGGKLIFNVAPTKDGNRRLAIYTSFQYKKGKGLVSQLLWDGVRLLFPEFVHDIVWNHALCTIKEDVERKHAPPPDSSQACKPAPRLLPALGAEK
jgi:hypothetical protein